MCSLSYTRLMNSTQLWQRVGRMHWVKLFVISTGVTLCHALICDFDSWRNLLVVALQLEPSAFKYQKIQKSHAQSNI